MAALRNSTVLVLFLLSLPALADVALLPLAQEGEVDEERAKSWWDGVLTGAKSVNGLKLQNGDGYTAAFVEQLGADLPACMNDIQCSADIAGSAGATHALRVRVSGNSGRVSVRIGLVKTDPVEMVRELSHDEAVVGPDAESAFVARAVRYALAPLAKSSERAQLTITANVEGAAVKIDGKGAGMAPFDKYDVAAGPHLVEVSTESASYRVLVDASAASETVVEAVLTSASVEGGGDTLAWTATGTGAGLVVVGAGMLGWSFLEAERLNAEIRAANAVGGFGGDDDPELARIRAETGLTHIVTAIAVGAIIVGASLTTLGVTLFFDEEG